MYQQQEIRKDEIHNFDNIEDYLSSLNIIITIIKVDGKNVQRLSQLSQKTNQFNLTTKRYTENDLIRFNQNNNYEVIAFSVEDKFGESGITSLCIIKYSNDKK